MRIEATPNKGRADRVSVGRPATMRDLSRAPVDVVVENLSETGALLMSADALPVGTLISLGIAGAGVQLARVTRVTPGALAAEFMLPLDPETVLQARSASTLVSVAFPQMLVESPVAAMPGGPIEAPARAGRGGLSLPRARIWSMIGLVVVAGLFYWLG